MSEKVIGYLLITAGILTAVLAAYSVYTVFTAQAQPVALFEFDAVTIPLSSLLGGESNLPVGDAEVEIFPAEILNKTTNTFAHLFLMGFLASVGSKIAHIGSSLVRPIIVRVNDQKLKSSILDPKK